MFWLDKRDNLYNLMLFWLIKKKTLCCFEQCYLLYCKALFSHEVFGIIQWFLYSLVVAKAFWAFSQSIRTGIWICIGRICYLFGVAKLWFLLPCCTKPMSSYFTWKLHFLHMGRVVGVTDIWLFPLDTILLGCTVRMGSLHLWKKVQWLQIGILLRVAFKMVLLVLKLCEFKV